MRQQHRQTDLCNKRQLVDGGFVNVRIVISTSLQSPATRVDLQGAHRRRGQRQNNDNAQRAPGMCRVAARLNQKSVREGTTGMSTEEDTSSNAKGETTDFAQSTSSTTFGGVSCCRRGDGTSQKHH